MAMTNEDLSATAAEVTSYCLSLEHTQVTDAGLVHLKKIPKLKCLWLNEYVTDAGLVHLKDLTSLVTLCVRNTQLTTKDTARLRLALPGCLIFR